MASQNMKAIDFEVAVNQPAALLWQVHIKNAQLSMPGAVPGHYNKVEYLEGPPLAPGGVLKIYYEEGFGHYDFVKLRWNEVDHENYYCKLTIFDGGAIGKHFSGLIYHYKILPGSNKNSSIMTWKIEYEDLAEHDFHDVLKDELIKLSHGLDAYINTLSKA